MLKQLIGVGFAAAIAAMMLAGGANANTVNITGATPPFAGYGTSVGNNNVVNNPASGVTDTLSGTTYYGSSIAGPAYVSTDLALLGSYNIDWWFIGAESGYVNTLIAPGINPAGALPNSPTAGQFNEANQNSNCCSAGGNIGPVFLGTSVAQTSTILDFTLIDDHGANLTNGASNPTPGTAGLESLIFSYVTKDDFSLTWTLTTDTTGEWFLFGFNDIGGPDDNHDDFVGVARVYLAGGGIAPPPVPLPAALPLFASALIGAGLVGRRRRRSA